MLSVQLPLDDYFFSQNLFQTDNCAYWSLSLKSTTFEANEKNRYFFQISGFCLIFMASTRSFFDVAQVLQSSAVPMYQQSNLNEKFL